jgi:RNA polymerase primary sigma factor
VTNSLDATVGDGDTTFGELHADEETPALDEEVIDRQRERAVAQALEQLPEAERKVLELRFGTAGEGEVSLRDVSRRLEIPQARVRELEARGLRRLAGNSALDAWREAA